MAARKKLPYRGSGIVKFKHPTDVENSDPLDFTDDESTCTFKVIDASKSEVLTAAEVISATVLNVTDAAVFKVGDTAEVDLDDLTIHDGGAITGVDPTAGTITITTALASGAAAGRRVRVRLGNVINMTEFGTAKLGTVNWGFRGALASNHPGLEIDTEIDIEISFVGAPGGGLDVLDVQCGVIRPFADCREI